MVKSFHEKEEHNIYELVLCSFVYFIFGIVIIFGLQACIIPVDQNISVQLYIRIN